MAKKKNSVYFNEKELNNILGYDEEYKKKIYITNDIFQDLLNCSEFKPKTSKVKDGNGQVNIKKKQTLII
ncbi:hypothetical protein [Gottfriedia solisilvae]|uniref:Uncharacterized protein n=1 Tax=Gottfriedia solisilvae TaxID=1516104 RepID=A0A8J3ATT9_9BACI|nr:hypothetical protein [Gottfriedia solisilvae]GGI18480.1 hypothetical protein GCM10007380_43120 [Gottfriedia solisilvae]